LTDLYDELMITVDW